MALQAQTLSFALTNRLSRQLFEYHTGHARIIFMYDSGAQMPVWCAGKEMLISAYPDVVETDLDCRITGFGEKAEVAKVFEIPCFVLKTEKAEYGIEKLLVANLYKPAIGCDMLISESMFSKCDTHTYRRGKRHLDIEFDDIGRYYQCTALRTGQDVNGVVVWAQI